MTIKTDLSKYNNTWYKTDAGPAKRLAWYMVNACFLRSYWLPVSAIKCMLLRLFGAKVGKGVNIKPGVNIKYPWKLVVGDYVWIGEGVWIDNLDQVTIGSHSCLSQDALLLCGNHNYKLETFDLVTRPITLAEGVWIGAKALVCPGVTCGSHAVLAAGSVATADLEAYGIYQGNPAVWKKERKMMNVE